MVLINWACKQSSLVQRGCNDKCECCVWYIHLICIRTNFWQKDNVRTVPLRDWYDLSCDNNTDLWYICWPPVWLNYLHNQHVNCAKYFFFDCTPHWGHLVPPISVGCRPPHLLNCLHCIVAMASGKYRYRLQTIEWKLEGCCDRAMH